MRSSRRFSCGTKVRSHHVTPPSQPKRTPKSSRACYMSILSNFCVYFYKDDQDIIIDFMHIMAPFSSPFSFVTQKRWPKPRPWRSVRIFGWTVLCGMRPSMSRSSDGFVTPIHTTEPWAFGGIWGGVWGASAI